MYIQFDGDIRIKQSLCGHVHILPCGDSTSRFTKKERETIPFVVLLFSKKSGSWQTKLRDIFMVLSILVVF